jgi:hypothetical protein
MLEISNGAMSFLRSTLESQPHGDSLFRLILQGDTLGLSVAEAEDGDVVYEQEGVAVVAASPDLAERLDTQVLDIEETASGTRLIMSA